MVLILFRSLEPSAAAPSDLGAGNDSLFVTGHINNGVVTTGTATAQKQTVITLGEGANYATFGANVVSSASITAGAGADTVYFGGNVSTSSVTLGDTGSSGEFIVRAAGIASPQLDPSVTLVVICSCY